MKALSSFAAIAALLAVTLSAEAQQRADRYGRAAATEPKAVGGPLKVIYRVSGVRNSAEGHEAGTATSFHCTSASAVVETLRIGLRNAAGNTIGTQRTTSIAPNATITLSTHWTNISYEDEVLADEIVIDQGSAHIMATSNKIFCSALIVDAGATVPQGIALHMVRFDPALGSQE